MNHPSLFPTPESHFEEFWAKYPKKVAKLDARRSWDRAVKWFSIEAVERGLDRQLKDWKFLDPQYIPHPATWLNRTDFGGEYAEEQTPKYKLNEDTVRILKRDAKPPDWEPIEHDEFIRLFKEAKQARTL